MLGAQGAHASTPTQHCATQVSKPTPVSGATISESDPSGDASAVGASHMEAGSSAEVRECVVSIKIGSRTSTAEVVARERERGRGAGDGETEGDRGDEAVSIGRTPSLPIALGVLNLA